MKLRASRTSILEQIHSVWVVRESGPMVKLSLHKLVEGERQLLLAKPPPVQCALLLDEEPAFKLRQRAIVILDRFLHHAEVIQITGRSYRLLDRASAGGANKTDNQACKNE